MPKLEKRVLEWMQTHLIWLMAAAALVLGSWARFALKTYSSGDFEGCLYPWYMEIKSLGGFAALSQQIGNYNMPYQFLIACMTYLPLPPIYAYKMLSIGFDFLLTFLCAWMTYCLLDGSPEETRRWGALGAGAVVFCCPTVILNSAAWAQCDSIYTFFIVAALAVLLLKERPLPAFLLLGAAFAFKLQAIFVLPFFLFLYFVRRKFTILHFALIPGMMMLLSAPGILAGRSWMDVFAIYGMQVGDRNELVIDYPSFWTAFGSMPRDYVTFNGFYHPLAVMVCVMLLGGGYAWLIRNHGWQTPRGMLYVAFLTIYTCVSFLPSMHERYGYACEILGVILVVLWPRTGALWLTMLLQTMVTYGQILLTDWDATVRIGLQPLSLLNMAVWVLYVVHFVHGVQAADRLAAEKSLPEEKT